MILALYGASGLGMEYLDVAKEMDAVCHKWDEIVFVDDDENKASDLAGQRVITFNEVLETYSKDEIEFIISIGEPVVKESIYKKIKSHGYRLTTLIHPSSSLGTGVQMGEGVVIQSFNRIAPMSKIGNNVLIQGTTCLGHEIEIGDNTVISSFDFIGGRTKVGKNTYVAPHSCLRNEISIGDNCIIGMGSVVTKDIPDNVVAFGNPCKVVRSNENGRVFSK